MKCPDGRNPAHEVCDCQPARRGQGVAPRRTVGVTDMSEKDMSEKATHADTQTKPHAEPLGEPQAQSRAMPPMVSAGPSTSMPVQNGGGGQPPPSPGVGTGALAVLSPLIVLGAR